MIAIIEMLLDEQEVSILNEFDSFNQNIELVKAYPNPFNASINISYTINHPSNTHLKIFDLNGRIILNQLLRSKESGNQCFTWSPKPTITSGIYFYSLESDRSLLNGRISYLK